MAQGNVSQLVPSLLEKQKSLNQAIDTYVRLASSKESQNLGLEAVQLQVTQISSSIASLTTNEFLEAVTWALRPYVNTALRIALDLDLFHHVAATPSTVDDIVFRTSADRTLILRITRCLAAFHILNETAAQSYTSTPISTLLTNPTIAAWLKMNHDNTIPRANKLPDYLAQLHHRGPINIDDFNAFAFGGRSMWDQLSENPSKLATFQLAMKLADERPPEATANYDFTANLGRLPPSGITIIDVGGGEGHALDSILARYPDLPGKFILEDLPGTIAQVKSNTQRQIRFEPVAHDFFTPQPTALRQPRWYHLRHVLHDWSDDSCVKILGHLRDAIAGSSNSSILISELVLPDRGARSFDTLLDMTMMQLGGMERSEAQWKEVLGKAGLEIKGSTRAKVGDRCILEVGVKD